MTKHPVTPAEMKRVAKSIGLNEYNEKAMTIVCLIARLGFNVTIETYNRNLPTIKPQDWQTEAEAQAADARDWLDQTVELRNQ